MIKISSEKQILKTSKDNILGTKFQMWILELNIDQYILTTHIIYLFYVTFNWFSLLLIKWLNIMNTKPYFTTKSFHLIANILLNILVLYFYYRLSHFNIHFG